MHMEIRAFVTTPSRSRIEYYEIKKESIQAVVDYVIEEHPDWILIQIMIVKGGT